MYRLLFVGLVVASGFAHSGEIHKCTVNGSVVYQGKPCKGSGKTVGQVMREENAKQKKIKEANIKREKEYQARMANKPRVGMSKQEAYDSSWGYPDDQNVTTTANSLTEQWVYRNSMNHKSKYLYFTNGILSSISE